MQRTAGIVAEPLLASPGRSGVAALAEGAGLLVVGLSERWSGEGLGRVRAELAGSPPAPMMFVRRGARPGGLAPPETRTRFSWSLTGSARLALQPAFTGAFTPTHPVLQPQGRKVLLDPAAQGGRREGGRKCSA